ncbi:MAG TPA: glycosyltransferase family 4 protein [Gemmatimonadaceae bacterium]|nr:glycosyltransferase family 4 protein [Gemmatimonadaceae bacterium]
MKLAILLPGGVDRGGVDRVIHSRLWLLERLARRHQVHVYAMRQEPEPGDWELVGARVHNVGERGARRLRLFARFAAEHRAAPFDVIHAFFGGLGTYAALLGWRHRVPVLYHPSGGEMVALDDIGYGMRRSARGRLALRVAFAGARRVTVASAFMRELAAGHGVDAERVAIGVALDHWPAAAPRPRDPARPARLLHVGDVRPVKDQATLLSAAARLLHAGVRFELDLAGLDTMNGALQRSADARRLSAVTRWHGVLRRDALRALVDRADVLLMTSRHEAGPLAVLEAAVAGVPTVGTAVGHVAEWAPEAAVAVPVGDAAALARETAALLADEPRRLAVARAAQRLAVADDADHTAARFEQIYEEMLVRRSSTSRRAPAVSLP